MSKKMIVVFICLLLALASLKCENRALGDAEARLIAKMLENERIVEVFSMDGEVVET